jgi:hypothetical protein
MFWGYFYGNIKGPGFF